MKKSITVEEVLDSAGITADTLNPTLFVITISAIESRINAFNQDGFTISKAHLLTTGLLNHIWFSTRKREYVLIVATVFIQAHIDSFHDPRIKFQVFESLAERSQFISEESEAPRSPLQENQSSVETIIADTVYEASMETVETAIEMLIASL